MSIQDQHKENIEVVPPNNSIKQNQAHRVVDSHLPLAGSRILITRAEHQSQTLVVRLRELGAETIEIPAIEIQPPDSWEELDQAIAKLTDYDWIVFASANAVRSFAQRAGKRIQSLEKPLIAVVGKSTEQVAQEHGFKVDYKPDTFIAESFIEQFPGYPRLSGLKVLWPRTNIGRNYLQEQFAKAGAQIDVVAAYKTGLPGNIASHSKNIHKLLSQGKIDVLTVASTQTAANLALIIAHKWTESNDTDNLEGPAKEMPDLLPEQIREVLKNVTVLSIGPETSRAAQDHLGKVDLEANPHTAIGMVDALIKLFGDEKR